MKKGREKEAGSLLQAYNKIPENEERNGLLAELRLTKLKIAAGISECKRTLIKLAPSLVPAKKAFAAIQELALVKAPSLWHLSNEQIGDDLEAVSAIVSGVSAPAAKEKKAAPRTPRPPANANIISNIKKLISGGALSARTSATVSQIHRAPKVPVGPTCHGQSLMWNIKEAVSKFISSAKKRTST